MLAIQEIPIRLGTLSKGIGILFGSLLLKKLHMFPSFPHRSFGLDQGAIGLSLRTLGRKNSFTGGNDGWVFGVTVKQPS